MSDDRNASAECAFEAARIFFEYDPYVFSVGIGRVGQRPVLRVSRGPTECGEPHSPWRLAKHAGLEIVCTDCDRAPQFQAAHVELTPYPSGSVPPRRILSCGEEVQNFALDFRAGHLNASQIRVGTLGCFVKLPSSKLALISNAHVLSPGDAARPGDCIYSAGSFAQLSNNHVANYAGLSSAPIISFSAGRPALYSPDWNHTDAAAALLLDGIGYEQRVCLPGGPVRLTSVRAADPGDDVYVCGRAGPCTEGVIEDVATILRLASPRSGEWFWFRRGLTIRSSNTSAAITKKGDSGAIIVRKHDKAIVGLHFAGNGMRSYANDMENVMQALNCQLA